MAGPGRRPRRRCTPTRRRWASGSSRSPRAPSRSATTSCTPSTCAAPWRRTGSSDRRPSATRRTSTGSPATCAGWPTGWATCSASASPTSTCCPLLKPRPGDNDGGYAVMDYRSVREDLGTMEDLRDLTGTLRAEGISLCLDLVLNHVAAEHEWAVRARAGEQRYRDYFHVEPDRAAVDAWEATLPEVFPDFAPGSFTWDDDLEAGSGRPSTAGSGTSTGPTPTSSASTPTSCCTWPTTASRRSGSTPSPSRGSASARRARTSRRCTPSPRRCAP